MTIELCGEPGAGKSSLLPIVIELLREKGMDATTAATAVDRRIAGGPLARVFGRLGLLAGLRQGRGRRFLVDIPWSLLVMVRSPRAVVRGIAAILRQPVTWRHRAVIFHRFIVPLAWLAFLRGRLGPGEAAILDEGPVHRAVNLFAWRHTVPPVAEVRAYVRDLPQIDVLLVVRAPAAIVRQRLADRGLPGYLRGRSADQVDRFLGHARAALSIAVAEMRDRAMIVEVDTGATPHELRGTLARALDGALLTRSPSDGWPLPAFEPIVRFGVPRLDRLVRRERTVDDQSAVDLVLEAVGLRRRGAARPVGRGRSRSALVLTEDGMVLVKRYKPSLSDAAIACEHAILLEIARQELPAPRLVSSPGGSTVHRCGPDRAAVFEAVTGHVPLHERVAWPGESAVRARLGGATLAVLHDALQTFWPARLNPIGVGPTGQRLVPTAWHRYQLMRPPHARDEVAADLLAAFPWVDDRLRRLEAEIGDGRLATTCIHGDYAPYNILARPGMPFLPIDFELARPDWRATDLAAAIPRFARSRLGFDPARARAFLEGYLDRAHWDPAEIAIIPHVAEYLALRRLAVCWSRWADGTDPSVLQEARGQLRRARSLANGSDPLVALCR